jgi:gliding motility-associated-like protein
VNRPLAGVWFRPCSFKTQNPGNMKVLYRRIIIVFLLAVSIVPVQAQTYTPVTVSGFNNDVVAEAGANAFAVTTTALDLSSYVLYTAGFATANSINGGVPNTGAIVNGTRTYQLASYTVNNGLFLSAAGTVPNSAASGVLTLTTPASFSRISLLVFSTEGNSTLSVVLKFTDGTTVTNPNSTVLDWFGGAGAVLTGFGRITRATAPPYSPDGLSTNPRFYPLDITIACGNQSKLLQSVTINYVSGSQATSRAVVLALSGVAVAPVTVTSVINPAICGGANGSIALTVTGGTAPLTYAWSTTPVQTTAIATNLAPGPYTVSIKDANNCVTTWQDVVPQKSPVILTASATPAAICAGEPVALSVTATGGTVATYTWTPGNVTGANITVSPAVTTTYTVSGQDAFGCNVSAIVPVTVKPMPTATFNVSPATVCLGSPQTVSFTGTAGANAVFNWNNFAGATVQSGNGAGPYNIVFNTAGPHMLQLQVTEDGCMSTVNSQAVTVTTPPVVSFAINKKTICAGENITVTFNGNAGSNATANWNWGGGIPQNGNGFGPFTVKYNNNGLITLSVNNGACTVSASQSVAVIPNPVAEFTRNQISGCAPVNVDFINQSKQGDAYTWDFGDGNTSTEQEPSHTYRESGSYTVTLTVVAQSRCTSTITKANLIGVQNPQADFTAVPGINTPVALSDATFSFTNNSSEAEMYLWHFGDGETAADKNPVHKYRQPGNYQVTLVAMDDASCKDSITYGPHVVLPDKVLQVPNAFSPNGDGLHDKWEVDGLSAFPNCQVAIYNRYGQRVFSSRGYNVPWDGMYNGKPLPTGTYYYVIKNLRASEMYSGWVELLR